MNKTTVVSIFKWWYIIQQNILFLFQLQLNWAKETKAYSYHENIILAISLKSGGMNLPNEKIVSHSCCPKIDLFSRTYLFNFSWWIMTQKTPWHELNLTFGKLIYCFLSLLVTLVSYLRNYCEIQGNEDFPLCFLLRVLQF